MNKNTTTLDMEISLMHYFGVGKNIIITNTFETMFESDLLSITPAGYATGVEIKVSKSDLKNDLKKSHIKGLGRSHWGKSGKEHYFGEFKRFYYAVPEFLKEDALQQIPDFCGLLIRKSSKNRNWIEEARKPQVLFKKKWSEKKMLKVAWLGTMRILGLKESVRRHMVENTQQTLF